MTMVSYSRTRAEERARQLVIRQLRRFIRKHGGSRKAAIQRAATELSNQSATPRGRG